MPVGMFHINPQDLKVGECKAKIACPFVEDANAPQTFNHYKTFGEAAYHAELMAEQEHKVMDLMKNISTGKIKLAPNVASNIHGFSEILVKNYEEAIKNSRARKPEGNDYASGVEDALSEIKSAMNRQRTKEGKSVAMIMNALNIIDYSNSDKVWNVYQRGYKQVGDKFADICWSVVNAKSKEDMTQGLRGRLDNIQDLEITVRERNKDYFEELRTASNLKHIGNDY